MKKLEILLNTIAVLFILGVIGKLGVILYLAVLLVESSPH